MSRGLPMHTRRPSTNIPSRSHRISASSILWVVRMMARSCGAPLKEHYVRFTNRTSCAGDVKGAAQYLGLLGLGGHSPIPYVYTVSGMCDDDTG